RAGYSNTARIDFITTDDQCGGVHFRDSRSGCEGFGSDWTASTIPPPPTLFRGWGGGGAVRAFFLHGPSCRKWWGENHAVPLAVVLATRWFRFLPFSSRCSTVRSAPSPISFLTTFWSRNRSTLLSGSSPRWAPRGLPIQFLAR